MIKLICGDCLELMKDIPDGSIDMVLTDPPYGTTVIKWDKVTDLELFWNEVKRITKKNAAICVFSKQPFTTDLINSNRKMFRYEWIWEKTCPNGFVNANRKPLGAHENICVFYQAQPTYNPQKTPPTRPARMRVRKQQPTQHYKLDKRTDSLDDGSRYPRDVIKASNFNRGRNGDIHIHPTQKPVDLLENFILTYTNKGETVLDCFMGSGSTGVACQNTGREFIGIELDKEYFAAAGKRIKMMAVKEQQIEQDDCTDDEKGITNEIIINIQ